MEKLQVGSSGKYVDEEMARELLENVRWPDGSICPHCVVVGGQASQLTASTLVQFLGSFSITHKRAFGVHIINIIKLDEE